MLSVESKYYDRFLEKHVFLDMYAFIGIYSLFITEETPMLKLLYISQ